MSNTNKKTSRPMRGMRDILPLDMEIRQRVLSIIEDVYTRYGFVKIETPAVERIDLLNSGEGGDNEKQMFRLLKRGISIDDIEKMSSMSELVDGGLRFDLTIPLARYFANNQAKLFLPFKTFQIANVWRAERPQKGRYRQFIQCDIDIIGDKTEFAEKELILATTEALTKIGFIGFKIRINDRRILKGIVECSGYDQSEFDSVFIIIDKLDKIGFDGIESELKKKFSNNEANTKLVILLRQMNNLSKSDNIFQLLPKNVDLSVISKLKEIIEFIKIQSSGNYQIVFDPTLVRGMGYYTGPIFEIMDSDFPSSIAGGGRYDKMISKYIGKDVSACGFSIGFERIISLLVNRNLLTPNNIEKKVLIFDSANVNMDFALKKADELRKKDLVICVQKRRKNTKKQLSELLAFGYSSFCLIQSQSGLDELQFKPLR